MTARASRRTPQPGPARRAATVLRFPLGLVISTTRYLWWAGEFHRTESIGDASDLPAPLPSWLVDDQIKTVDDGAGPLFHRWFRVRIRDHALDARALIDTITADLDRAAPSEVVSFRKQRGELGSLQIGDEYQVRMPAPWDGPVRVVARDPTSFRFATLAGHLEAGQIEFRAQDIDTDEGLAFEIEVWSRAGDRLADLVFDQLRVGKEIQLHMWAQFCLSASVLARGRRDGVITIHTRRAPWPAAGDQHSSSWGCS